jgi:hypothetical protein
MFNDQESIENELKLKIHVSFPITKMAELVEEMDYNVEYLNPKSKIRIGLVKGFMDGLLFLYNFKKEQSKETPLVYCCPTSIRTQLET